MNHIKTISIIGKSTLPTNNASYQFSEKLAYELMRGGFTIVHGGYAGGIMEAVSTGASRAITKFGLSKQLNMGVPEERFDANYTRTNGGYFTKPAKDICDRLRTIILNSDCIVVAPRGGNGTMLELQLAIHENTLSAYTGIIRPIIACELPGETPWSDILETQIKNLDNRFRSIKDIPRAFNMVLI